MAFLHMWGIILDFAILKVLIPHDGKISTEQLVFNNFNHRLGKTLFNSYLSHNQFP